MRLLQLTAHQSSHGGPAERLSWAAQATKEAEYRDKVADLKARIDSNTARRTAEQEHENTAKVACLPPGISRCLHSILCLLTLEQGRPCNVFSMHGRSGRAFSGVCKQ